MPALTAESFINNTKRSDLVLKIQKDALAYKNAFAVVENICDNNIYIPGCMNQVLTAINDDTGKEFMPEVVLAKNCFMKLQESIQELIDDGVPGIIGVELSRRVLEENIVGAEEFVYYC